MYEGLRYRLALKFPNNYPYAAPTVTFITPCFHPNVDEHGNICLDILKENWSALYDVRTILLSIQSLLAGTPVALHRRGRSRCAGCSRTAPGCGGDRWAGRAEYRKPIEWARGLAVAGPGRVCKASS